MRYSNDKMNEYMKNRWLKRRAKAIAYLGGKCSSCSATEGLEFDHIDSETKLFTIAKGSSFSEERFWAEVDKCQLLCNDCHVAKSKDSGDYSRHKAPLAQRQRQSV